MTDTVFGTCDECGQRKPLSRKTGLCGSCSDIAKYAEELANLKSENARLQALVDAAEDSHCTTCGMLIERRCGCTHSSELNDA